MKHISVILPLKNESARLRSAIIALKEWQFISAPHSEIILIENGSTDNTWQMCQSFADCYADIRALRSLPGKGAAVRAGMLAARGDLAIMADVDMAVSPAQWGALLNAKAPVAIATREGGGAARVGEPEYRHLMGRVFNALSRAALPEIAGIRDSQCGYKVFARDVIRPLFDPLFTIGFAFDLEIIARARRLGIDIAQVPVLWQHDTDSRVRPIADAAAMLADTLRIRRALRSAEITPRLEAA